ncbi:MAG: DUF1493 family protein [Pantoea sp.]|uniref:DUF1493 family protein n=1 Tax=Pantoea sp. TaxID=69393 RepID=UPI0039E5E7A9
MIQFSDETVREFVKKELPLVTTILLRKVEMEDDSPLQELYEPEDVDEMLAEYFEHFHVDQAGFEFEHYFPWKTKSFFSRNPVNLDKKPLTIRMLIESANAGRWLYD